MRFQHGAPDLDDEDLITMRCLRELQRYPQQEHQSA